MTSTDLRQARYHFRMMLAALGWPLVQHVKRAGADTSTTWRLAGPASLWRLLWAKVRGREVEMWARELDAGVDRLYAREAMRKSHSGTFCDGPRP